MAACEGMEKAVKMLCDELNIWCIPAMEVGGKTPKV